MDECKPDLVWKDIREWFDKLTTNGNDWNRAHPFVLSHSIALKRESAAQKQMGG